MSNHLSPASVSEHSSYAASSSHLGASPAPSHHSTATSFSSSSPSPSSKMNANISDTAEFESLAAKPITCRWDDCGKVFYDPEVVYMHLCDDHVGRKSTNNLCLTCKWEGCDVSCAKRDHITSHIRVHTPLKPHNCDVCGKNFKRPQDLKKHERIHTEQHQQQRQHKAAQNAAARAYSTSEHTSSFGAYPYPPVHAPNSYLGYPAVPTQHALYPSASAYPSAYPSLPTAARDHYAHSTSSASLSPMSSRIDTPQGSSPASIHYAQDRGSYMHLASSLDPRSKVTTDPTSYLYLAHGATTSHNLAGSKRGHEQVEDFFGDLRRKKMAPAYDSQMAERLNQTFGVNGIDDVSLNAILSTFDPSAAYGQAQVNPAFNKMEATRAQAKQESTDLAQLNAFLLQLGASAASTLGGSQSQSFSSNASSSSASSSFSSQGRDADFDFSSLSQYGLTNIPGFDESLLANGQRSIAQLPSRAQGHYGGHIYYPDTSSYSTQMQQPSFDNVRVARGPAIVPQLAPMDAGGHSYRRVEALTRAAPEEASLIRAGPYRHVKAEEQDAMEEDELDDDASQVSSRFRSVSPAASSEAGWSEAAGRRGSSSPSHGLYPRVSPIEASRRLPPIRSNSASTCASISSLLDSESPRGVSSQSDSRQSAPGGPPTPSCSSSCSSSSSSSSLYPSLVDRVSQMEGLGRPHVRSPSAPASEESSEAMRREHVRLIRDLLIAINFPEKARAKVQADHGIRLPPILTASLPHRRNTEDGEITPSAVHKEERLRRDDGSDRNSTPTPPGRPTLPTLSQLLNDIPKESRALSSSRPMREREMECDV
ncbi:probable Transcription factor pacC [Melanopsichium pennsylvanicum]|uniref:Transcription factor pacC n=2 Tax=Melanopsichium pennsylvanicum TaxID=63383 RepID=A0A077RC23_9BASI|nr:transcription factor pacC [Melanopsichium pennsylvanicum 4]SNX86159.1 probable Transcription factor pacC [Melanopsichium pennsylvanicum]